MPVEIRELQIHTNIASRSATEKEMLSQEKIAQLKKQIVQECLRVLKDKTARTGFER